MITCPNCGSAFDRSTFPGATVHKCGSMTLEDGSMPLGPSDKCKLARASRDIGALMERVRRMAEAGDRMFWACKDEELCAAWSEASAS